MADVIGGPSQVRIFDHYGHPLGTLSALPVSAIEEVVHTINDNVVFHVATYLDPPAWYSLNAENGKSSRTALVETSLPKFDDAEVTRECATAKDGTIPVNLIRRKGTKSDERILRCWWHTEAMASASDRVLWVPLGASDSTRAAST